MTDRYRRGLDRMRELRSAGQSDTFDHVKLVESHESLDEHPSGDIVSFAFGDIHPQDSLFGGRHRPLGRRLVGGGERPRRGAHGRSGVGGVLLLKDVGLPTDEVGYSYRERIAQ